MKKIAIVALIACCAIGHGNPVVAQQAPAWTYESALEQLRLYPRDAYLQYVVLQLGARSNRRQAAEREVRNITNERARNRAGRSGRVNLFSMFTGALAVQESLQLDAMGAAGNQAESPSDEMVKISALTGPTVKSHPWTEMLAGKTPERSRLSYCVPADYFFVRFRSVATMLSTMDSGDVWGTHLFSQSTRKAYSYLTRQRLETQLAIETNTFARPFYDLVVEEIAATGSDLYTHEGSDLTLLFRFRQAPVFKSQMNRFLANAQKQAPDAVRTTGKYNGIDYVQVATPDRHVNVFSAYPQDGLHVRSNSRVAFERVLDTIAAKARGEQVTLGDTHEFAYVRSLMNLDDPHEDGLIYLSDPFIRRLTGPQLKLTQRRRRICYNHLRMIGHGAAMFQTEHGRAPASLVDIANAKCSPGTFGDGRLACPCEGEYQLSADGLTGICTYHGQVGTMRPCCETPLDEVTADEAKQYRAFVTEYSRYWRTFFDPIAVKIGVRPEHYRVETIILPLIDNSIYSQMAMVLGGEPKSLESVPVPERNIFSVAMQWNKAGLLTQSGWQPPDEAPDDTETAAARRRSVDNLFQLALAMHNYHSTHNRFPPIGNYNDGDRPLLSWRVHLLPFLEQNELYQKFRLDEPWDSEHNRMLIAEMPEIYRSPGRKAAKPGTTTYTAPAGPDCINRGTSTGTRIRDITDGTSNTIMVMDVAEKRAVAWTKPDDMLYQPATFRESVFSRFGETGLAAMADGSVRRLPKTLTDDDLNAMITRSGGEVIRQRGEVAGPRRRRNRGFILNDLTNGWIDERMAYDMVTRGIGDQIGFHVYDADPQFDFQFMGFLGQSLGNFTGRRGFDNDIIPFVLMGSSLNAPIYLSIPTKDNDIVDAFLKHLDTAVARYVRGSTDFGFFRFEQDFYRLPITDQVEARSLGVQFGPVKWRFFWSRIGNAVYVASKPEILKDLAAMTASPSEESSDLADRGERTAGHAMLKVRSKHWNKVLSAYRMGWAEQHRLACLDNVSRMSNIARMQAAQATPAPKRTLADLSLQLHGVKLHCPEGGEYHADGHDARCTIHGTAMDPRQPAVPKNNGAIDRMLKDFSGLTVTLTFLEDGLHAVLFIDRR